MDLTTCFKILGLGPRADTAQARQAYKRLVRRWHPDQFPEGSVAKAQAEEQLKQINIAYARIKPYLFTRRPDPTPQAEPPPAAHKSAPDVSHRPSTAGRDQGRSWIDHLFERLNAFVGRENEAIPPESADDSIASRRRSFKQVLDEMAGSAELGPRDTTTHRTTRRRRSVATYGRHGGSNVESIQGTSRVEPVQPVGRVRGIGKGR